MPKSAPLIETTVVIGLIDAKAVLAAEGDRGAGSPVDAVPLAAEFVADQQWNPVLQPDGYYVFFSDVASSSDLSLEAAPADRSGVSATTLGPYHGDPDMEWSAVQVSQTASEFVNAATGLCLQFQRRGLPAVTAQCTASDSQLWILIIQNLPVGLSSGL